jgi:N-acetylglucosamine-6-phosphate deacetylase
VIIDAANELYALRADAFAREFGLNLLLNGSGNEYRRLEAIRLTGWPVIVPLDFPRPPNVSTPETALSASLEDMMHWDHAPENPARLASAGIKIAFTTHGLRDTNEFLANLRKAVERGLNADTALHALTINPAEIYGVSDKLGTIAAGKAGHLVITDGDLFAQKTKLIETWVDGRRYVIDESPTLDIRGKWETTITIDNQQRMIRIEINGTPTALQGNVVLPATTPAPDTTEKKEVQIPLSQIGLVDGRFGATFPAKEFGREGTARWSAVVSANADAWTGFITWPDATQTAADARRTAPPDVKPAEEPKPPEQKSKAASFAVRYPLGEFGREKPPEQPANVLFTGATVWTNGPQGVLENASVLIGGGKILAVAPEIPTPPSAVVISAAGKHITPGLIDCHSHIATDGGINETGQAITAEVRIGDFINCDHFAIYEQLAGGVTAVNVLHGSANPIGGQNQVLKLRWGALPEEMKFASAPPGIKFALGENVKQSNWGEAFTSRYPQTRMGVEQIIRDEFLAAQQYGREWENWQRDQRGLPPRRDLELEAIAEVLYGNRWIHCHSYRQDEILALLRTLDEFKITIGTLQHILEGYKVADAMARHGAMGSSFADWWAYKFEVYDAIPYNGALMHDAGVVVSFNSDDRELARHLNQEAAKAVKYGDVPPAEALKFVTLNPARQLRIDSFVGSLETGKDADLVVWNGPPLSNYALCEQTWVDGRKYFDRAEDQQQRVEIQTQRAALIQKILESGETPRQPGEGRRDPRSMWPSEDIEREDKE